MSDFLQSLVLRAAGLPLTAAAAPRELPSAEPLESAPDEESVDVAAAPDAARATPVAPVPARAQEERRATAPQANAGAPPEVIDQFDLIEQTVIHEHDAPVRAEEVPVRIESPAPAATTEIIEREIIVERDAASERRDAEPPQFVVAPQPAAIEVPRETIVEREIATEPVAARDEQERRPVVLQPIVLDQTRTIVEPVREERTVVETHTERVLEPAPPQREVAIERDESAPPRALVEPRTNIAPQQTTEADVSDAPREEPRSTPESIARTNETAVAQPRTLVVAPPPAPQPEREAREPQPELAIHIGTIEIRAAAPPPPPAPAQQTIVQHAPEPASNFDDYAAVRNYIFPDVWR
jgi:hypothetical protein